MVTTLNFKRASLRSAVARAAAPYIGLFLLTHGGLAHADTIVTYDISARTAFNIAPPVPVPGGTLTGTLAVDYTNLDASVANITYQADVKSRTDPFGPGPFEPGPYTATFAGRPSSIFEVHDILLPDFSFSDGAGSFLTLALDSGPGSHLCTYLNSCVYPGLGLAYSTVDFPAVSAIVITGTATPVAPTPEPSSLALLLTGALGALGVSRRKNHHAGGTLSVGPVAS